MDKDSELVAQKPVVVMVHGIRDHALWHDKIRTELEAAGYKVELTNYGRFGLLEFLSPFSGGARRVAREDLESQMNVVFRDHGDAEINIIAHSFGTYLITEIIRLRSDLIFKEDHLCRAVLKRKIPFQDYSTRFTPKILNEIGDRDPWPAFAQSLTWCMCLA